MSCKSIEKRIILMAALVVISSSAAFGQLAVTGIVRPVEEVIIKSELSGVIQKIAVKEGDKVREGNLLIELGNEHQKIALDLSKSRLAKAKAAVEEAEVLLENSEKELARIQIAATALPRKELENIKDQILRIQANLAAQMAEVVTAEHEIRLREQELRDTQILAPFTGTVTEIFVARGESLRSLDTPILELVDMDRLYAELRLPSSYMRSVQLDQTVKVQIEGEWLGRVGLLDGRITYINPAVDAASRTFKVKVGIPPRGLVRPGMLVEARFGP
jgi:membrane fusion protein, multidrug efflux system